MLTMGYFRYASMFLMFILILIAPNDLLWGTQLAASEKLVRPPIKVEQMDGQTISFEVDGVVVEYQVYGVHEDLKDASYTVFAFVYPKSRTSPLVYPISYLFYIDYREKKDGWWMVHEKIGEENSKGTSDDAKLTLGLKPIKVKSIQ